VVGRRDLRQRAASRRDRDQPAEVHGGLQTPIDMCKTVAKGTATSVLLAASPLLASVGARYFEDLNEARVLRKDEQPVTFGGGGAPRTLDRGTAMGLWAIASELTG
jgi:hypothetical protein